jgi:hypothetical protein
VKLTDEEASRYLLGELSEADELALEELVLADAEAFATLELAEDDLFEACVREELGPAARARFVERFLRTPEGQQRLGVVRGLVERAAAAKPAPVAAKLPWWRRPILQLGLAAAVLLVCAIGLWRQRDGDGGGGGGETQFALVTVELTSATRSEGETVVELPHGAGERVLVQLRPDVRAPRLRLTLLGPGGKVVLPPLEAAELVVDAAHLPDGRYELRAQRVADGDDGGGRGRGGVAEDLAFYGFRIVRAR